MESKHRNLARSEIMDDGRMEQLIRKPSDSDLECLEHQKKWSPLRYSAYHS